MIRLVKWGWARVSVKGLGRNSLFSMGQSLTTIACVFLSYRFLIAEVGLAGLGLWSLLMVFGGVAMTFDISGASALARSVARHDMDFADVERPDVVHTVLITSLLINGAMIIVLLAALPFVLPSVIAAGQMAEAWRLIPWVAGLMVVTPLAVGISASIDGVMRADQRAILASAAAVTGLLVAAVAIPRLGIMGIALSQAVQQAMVIIGGWLILRGHIGGLGWWPRRWKAVVARRTTGYALKLNTVGALGLLLEPLTKFCINHAGGPAAVGVYELAARLAVQLRNLIVASTSPLVPAFAATEVTDPLFASLLAKAQRYAIFAAAAVGLSSLATAPVMSVVILGHVSAEVLQSNALLAFGWAVNLFSLPLYIAAQGQGVLRWNMIAHAFIGCAVIAATVLLTPMVGASAAVFGVSAGLAGGAAIAMIGNASQFRQMAVLRRQLVLILGALVGLIALCSLAWPLAQYLDGVAR